MVTPCRPSGTGAPFGLVYASQAARKGYQDPDCLSSKGKGTFAGLVAYSVSRRTREIGIRVAIRADQPKVARMVLGQGLKLAAAGVAARVVSVAVCRAMMSATWFLVFDRIDPLVFVAIALHLLMVTTLCCVGTGASRFAGRPMRALREE